MSAQQLSLSTRARWIIRTRLAAVSPARRHTPGIHTRATGFLPFTGPARAAVTPRPRGGGCRDRCAQVTSRRPVMSAAAAATATAMAATTAIAAT